MKRLTLTFGLLALAAVLAACSDASAGAPAPAAPAGSPTAVVRRELAALTGLVGRRGTAAAGA